MLMAFLLFGIRGAVQSELYLFFASLRHQADRTREVRVGHSHAFAPVFFGRRIKAVPAEEIASALSNAGGVALTDPKIALPNGHQARAVTDLLIVEDGVERLDLAVLERILVGLPADPADEPEEWFDAKTGRLRLQHMLPAAL